LSALKEISAPLKSPATTPFNTPALTGSMLWQLLSFYLLLQQQNSLEIETYNKKISSLKVCFAQLKWQNLDREYSLIVSGYPARETNHHFQDFLISFILFQRKILQKFCLIPTNYFYYLPKKSSTFFE